MHFIASIMMPTSRAFPRSNTLAAVAARYPPRQYTRLGFEKSMNAAAELS
jgi:hypothetical protein